MAQLARSVYYYWHQKQGPSNHEGIVLIRQIKAIIYASRGTYGYRESDFGFTPTRHYCQSQASLSFDEKTQFTLHQIYPSQCGYQSYRGKIGPIAKNLLQRNFDTQVPNEKWVTDITQFQLEHRGQRLYLAPVMDLWNSQILSFSLSRTPDMQLVMDAFEQAVDSQEHLSNLTIHSDQGFHYQNWRWRDYLERHGIQQSMSRRGKCFMENPLHLWRSSIKQSTNIFIFITIHGLRQT